MISLDTITPHAAARPLDIALTDDNRSLTWSAFRDSVAPVRGWLAAELTAAGRSVATADGEPAQHRIVAYAGNTVELVVATAAASSLGVPWVGIDPSRDWDTAHAQLSAVRPNLVIVDSSLFDGRRLAEAASAAGARVLDLGSGPGIGTSYRDALRHSTDDVAWSEPPFVSLGFTSGSTGTPKLFLRHSRSENQRLAYLRDTFAFGSGAGGIRDVYLVTSPLVHASGHVWVNAALTLGVPVVFESTEPNAIAETISRQRVTAAFMVPPTLDAFLATAIDRPDIDLTSVRALLTGGRHISARAVRQAASRLGDVLHLYYATTETGINTFATPLQLAEHPLTAGFPLPGVRLLIVDPTSQRPLPADEVGLIAICGKLNLDGYASGQAELVSEGGDQYVLTSDYGYLDANGELFILGRADTLPGGTELNVVALEAELKELPDVRDACIIRQRVGSDVEVVAAYSADPVDEDVTVVVRNRLGQLLDSNVAHRAIPVRQIPYNTAGKVDVRALNALLGASLGSRLTTV